MTPSKRLSDLLKSPPPIVEPAESALMYCFVRRRSCGVRVVTDHVEQSAAHDRHLAAHLVVVAVDHAVNGVWLMTPESTPMTLKEELFELHYCIRRRSRSLERIVPGYPPLMVDDGPA
jgi:hypothetical protein